MCNSAREDTSPASSAPTAKAAATSDKENKKAWTCEICSHKNAAGVNVCELCANNVENVLGLDDDDDDGDNSPVQSHSLNRSLSSTAGDYNSTMNASLTYRSQRAMSTLKTYANATNQAEKIWKNIVKYCKEHVSRHHCTSCPCACD